MFVSNFLRVLISRTLFLIAYEAPIKLKNIFQLQVQRCEIGKPHH